MSFDTQQLEEHCHKILNSARIKNKILILCEGDLPAIKGTESPQSYSKIEQLPDANFYKACVPQKYNQYLPQFFNCGDRSSVIKTYFRLLELHQENSSQYYLNPNKLFAIVDLDNQDKTIEYYSFPSTDAIFFDLYQNFQVNPQNAPNHRIWTTGLIHKEAYFIIPELQDFFDSCINIPYYKNNPLSLNKIYLDMAESIIDDIDLEINFQGVKERLKDIFDSDFHDKNDLKDLWIDKFNVTVEKEQKDELIQVLLTLGLKMYKRIPFGDSRIAESLVRMAISLAYQPIARRALILALLTIKKAKNFWENIQPPEDVSILPERFQEQLSLEIARQFYAKQSNNPKYHIPYFLETIQKILENRDTS